MPRIKPINPTEATGKTRTLLDGVQNKTGTIPNVFRTLAHAPAALEAYLSFGQALDGGSLSPLFREQIALAVSNANGCQYCASAHTATGKTLGLAQIELTENLVGSSSDPKVEVALQFARAVIAKRGWVNDSEIEHVREAGYTDEEIVELIATIASTMFTNYFNHIAETKLDFPKVEVGQPVATMT
ncbi:MAG: peroxidase-related enzyme [Planctomycetes bacterium]|nr:peroxidase-related enzyme [Planctomycetota bacterium]